MSIGSMKITTLVASRFRLDGGSMFGVVPRAMWEPHAPPDERNRILLNGNSLLVETGGKRILVEAGMGLKYSPRLADIYALEELEVTGVLEDMGTTPDQVDVVVLTHLHLDHAGGATLRDEAGPRPAFPNATYLVQVAELASAVDPHPLARGSYSRDDFLPLYRRGQLVTVNGEAEAVPGVRLELTAGHTPGHQVVRFISGDEEAVYPGDLVPTAAHLRPNWLMAWDLDPRETFARKSRLLEEAARGATTLFFSHDPVLAACRISKTDGGFEVIEGSEMEAS